MYECTRTSIYTVFMYSYVLLKQSTVLKEFQFHELFIGSVMSNMNKNKQNELQLIKKDRGTKVNIGK